MSTLTLAVTAATATTVISGGSFLAGPVVQKVFDDAGPITLYDYTCNSVDDICYSYVGGGDGITGFLNNDVTQLGLTQTSPITGDDYAVTETILSSAQSSGFRATYGYQLIQVPAFATPIALAFNYLGRTSDGAIKLTDDDLCGIFSGRILDWSGITTHTGLSGPIAVAYDDSGSGETFLFTNHLASVCPSGILPGSRNFVGTTRFATLFPGYASGKNSTGRIYDFVPTNTFAGAVPSEGLLNGITNLDGSPLELPPGTGRPGRGSFQIQQQIMDTEGITVSGGTYKSLGYIGPDYTAVKGVTPVLVPGVAAAPHVASVIPAGAATPFLPNLKDTTAAVASFRFTPVATDPNTFGVLVPVPRTGYPIVGYAYIDLSSRYSSAVKVQAVELFLDCLYNVGGTTCPTIVADLNKLGVVPVPGVMAAMAPQRFSLAGEIIKEYLHRRATVPITSGNIGR